MIPSKKAEMAMGTLIIFIAMIIISATAAGVLITTINSFQTKALETGRATRAEIGTSLQVVEISGTGANIDRKIHNITATVKLSAGSDDVRFDGVLLTLGLENATKDYIYNKSANCSEVVKGEYAVEYSIKGNNNIEGYLTRGDIARICFQAERPIGESERFRISIIPRVGTQTRLDMYTPYILSRHREVLFP
ncbi:MAG: hypothetical protein ACMXX5_01005 [Candidatus Woesearchaeota archaeon]